MDIYTPISSNNKLLRRAIIMAHNFKCFYAKGVISVDDFSIDRIIPLKYGGTNCIANYVPTAHYIDKMKGNIYNEPLREVQQINEKEYAPKVLQIYSELVENKK